MKYRRAALWLYGMQNRNEEKQVGAEWEISKMHRLKKRFGRWEIRSKQNAPPWNKKRRWGTRNGRNAPPEKAFQTV